MVNALVFSRTKHGADKIAKDLNKQGIPAAAIHGNKSQTARVTALEDFKAGKTRVLVATDIAARGIDISELSHVFNYDLPRCPRPTSTALAARPVPVPTALPSASAPRRKRNIWPGSKS